ncbi:MAG: hypothetical protein HFH14_02385 [Lachnospiraceae bacterium]|nr:hypothetical protein [Lachnospiraceae bacterium]
MDRTAYKNRHIKEHYDRINLVIPKVEKDRIKKICTEIGASINEYLYMLIRLGIVLEGRNGSIGDSVPY